MNDELRMDAYYYSFERTGVDAIDKILSAVACAGKSAHHTRDWGGQNDSGQGNERPPFEGTTCIQWIQNAANEAAQQWPAPSAEGRGREVSTNGE